MLLEQLLQPVLCHNSEFWLQCGAPGSLFISGYCYKERHA